METNSSGITYSSGVGTRPNRAAAQFDFTTTVMKHEWIMRVIEMGMAFYEEIELTGLFSTG